MKAAYIFFGQVKNFDNRQYHAFEKNVKKQLSGYDVDYFLVTSRSSNYDNPRQEESEGRKCKINHNSIKRHFDFKCIYYDELDQKKDTEIDDLAETIVTSFGGTWEEDSLLSTSNSLKQLYSLEYFYEQFSKCGFEYDIYILSRSDLFHTQDLKMDFVNQDYDLLAPYFEDYPQIDYGWFGGINDRFAVIKNNRALKTYCCRYSRIKSKPQPYHAEKYLLQQLESDAITYGRIPSFNFRLIRANGNITDLIGITVDEYVSINLNKISEAYFINLERRKDRLEHINKNLRFHAERFEAVDAQTMQVNDEIKKLFPKDYLARPKAEICCALSHYKLWKKLIADECAENYLIMEDDVVFKPGFKEFWNDVFSRDFPENSLVTYLGGCQPWNKPHYHKVLKQYNEYFNTVKKNDYFSKDDHYWQMNAHSYIMSKQAAILLCDWVDEHGMNCALDHFILNFFTKNKKYFAPHRIYHLNPLMTYQLHEENDNTELDKKSDLRFAKETFSETQKKSLRAEDLFVPKKTNLTKFRCGKDEDGGYVLLKEIFNKIDTVYSYGIDDSEGSDSFDVECANSGKKVYMYDGTIDRQQSSNPSMIFKKENLTNENFKLHIQGNGDGDRVGMLLKMDIEGCEYPVIESNLDLIDKHFDMLCIEFHGLNNPEYYNFENKLEVIELLLQKYDIFHMHANNWVERKFKVPNVLEVSLIRKGTCLPEVDCAYPIQGLDFPNCKERDDYILDWWITKKQSESRSVFYWHHSVGQGNFGDELNIPVGKFLFGEDTSFDQKNTGKLIHLIGSNLAGARDGDLICGVGLHHHTQKIASKDIQVKCVRGPLSLKTLNQQVDQPVECFLGDPALLLKLFHKPDLREELVDKIGVVPHISNIDYFQKQVDQLDDFYLIDPTNSWKQVVSEIYSCKLVISSSLHGLICADAYDKPNVWIKIPGMSIPPCDKNSNYGDFKYWDYLMSQGRDVHFINHLTDDFEDKIYTQGNKIDLQKMYQVLSGKTLISNDSFPHLKEISSKQIPKKIHLSWKDKNVLSSDCALIQKGAKNLERLNPDWDVQVYDDEDINRLLRDSIGRDDWDLIKDKKITEKTDLWRLIKTYKEGGMYVDIDRYVDTSLDEIIDLNTSCVIPTFQDVDFSQDFILTCEKNPVIGRAIGANLSYRKQGKNLFFLAVYSYMHAVSSVLSGKIIERGDNPGYFNDMRQKFDACEYIKTYREIGPENHILFRNKAGDFSMDIFDRDKADFYNSYQVRHWNDQTQAKHNSLKSSKRKMIFLQDDMFEEDFICELFSRVEFEKIVDTSMSIVEQDSIIVYGDIYSANTSIYPDQARDVLNERKIKYQKYFEQFKNKNCILVHLSDEHCHAEIGHYQNFKHVFRQYYRGDAVADNVTFIPLGYKKGFNS